MVICLERGADLNIAQLMPLPLTVSCFGKIQIGFTFLVPAHPGSPGQKARNPRKRAVKRVCVCILLTETDWIAEFAKKQELAEKANKLKVFNSVYICKYVVVLVMVLVL